MSELPELMEGLSNLSGWDRGRDRPVFLHESGIDFSRARARLRASNRSSAICDTGCRLAEPRPITGRPHSIVVTPPPLGIVVFTCAGHWQISDRHCLPPLCIIGTRRPAPVGHL